jgi:hypothetical protein
MPRILILRIQFILPGYFVPFVPTSLVFPTRLPLWELWRSNITSATTPIFLSEALEPPPTYPVVYSPVPTLQDQQCIFADLTISTLGELEAIAAKNPNRSMRYLCVNNWGQV